MKDENLLWLPFLHSRILVKKEWFEHVTKRNLKTVTVKIRNQVWEILQQALQHPDYLNAITEDLYKAAFEHVMLENAIKLGDTSP